MGGAAGKLKKRAAVLAAAGVILFCAPAFASFAEWRRDVGEETKNALRSMVGDLNRAGNEFMRLFFRIED